MVVAAPAGVELLAGIPRAFCEDGFHKAVDIFVIIRDLQPALVYLIPDLVERSDDRIPLLFCDDIPGCQHGYMGNAAGYILAVKSLVIADRSVEAVGQLVLCLCESASPEFHMIKTFFHYYMGKCFVNFI